MNLQSITLKINNWKNGGKIIENKNKNKITKISSLLYKRKSPSKKVSIVASGKANPTQPHCHHQQHPFFHKVKLLVQIDIDATFLGLPHPKSNSSEPNLSDPTIITWGSDPNKTLQSEITLVRSTQQFSIQLFNPQ